jgi:hypothetical protein
MTQRSWHRQPGKSATMWGRCGVGRTGLSRQPRPPTCNIAPGRQLRAAKNGTQIALDGWHTRHTDRPRLKRNGAAGWPVCVSVRRCSGNPNGGSTCTVSNHPWRCARECSRLAEAVPEGKAIAYRRSTSRKVVGVMPMCRVNTAVK